MDNLTYLHGIRIFCLVPWDTILKLIIWNKWCLITVKHEAESYTQNMQWKMRCLSSIHFPFLITLKSRKQNYVVYYIYQLIDAFGHSCSIAHTDSSLQQVRVHFGTLPHTWGHTSTVAIGPQDSRIKYPCIMRIFFSLNLF